MARPTRFGGLWRDANFLKVWAALSISLMGTQVTSLALPLIAVLTLGASPFQMGLLTAAGRLPYLLVSLPAGVWVDRSRRRPMLIATDVGSAMLLLSLPVAVGFGLLALPQLYIVAFGIGAFAVLSEVAHRSYVPSLINRIDLVDGNSKLQISYSVASSAGPGLGGLLIQLVSAPMAVLADVASFLVSALVLRTIGRKERPPAQPAQPESFRGAIWTGLQVLLSHPLLRPIILARATADAFGLVILALYILYVTQEFGLDPLTIGVILAVGGLCAIPGAMLAPWVARQIGVGWAIIGGWGLAALAGMLVPLAFGSTGVVIAMLTTAQALGGIGGVIANIHQWSLRQAVTPDALQGRINAGHRFFVFGAGTVGGLLGGSLGATVGLRPALLICALGALLSLSWVLFSPVRELREQPTQDWQITPSPSRR